MIGVLTLDRNYLVLPGNVAHPGSYDYPVLINRIEGLSNPPVNNEERLNNAEARVVDAVVKIVSQGASMVVLSCGFFSIIHQRVARSVDVPVVSSPILLIPSLLSCISSGGVIGVATLFAEDLTFEYFQGCGVSRQMMRQIVLTDMSDASEFRRIILDDSPVGDIKEWQYETVRACSRLVERYPNMKALVLECSDMPPFKNAIIEETGLPVFDYFSLIQITRQMMANDGSLSWSCG